MANPKMSVDLFPYLWITIFKTYVASKAIWHFSFIYVYIYTLNTSFKRLFLHMPVKAVQNSYYNFMQIRLPTHTLHTDSIISQPSSRHTSTIGLRNLIITVTRKQITHVDDGDFLLTNVVKSAVAVAVLSGCFVVCALYLETIQHLREKYHLKECYVFLMGEVRNS